MFPHHLSPIIPLLLSFSPWPFFSTLAPFFSVLSIRSFICSPYRLGPHRWLPSLENRPLLQTNQTLSMSLPPPRSPESVNPPLQTQTLVHPLITCMFHFPLIYQVSFPQSSYDNYLSPGDGADDQSPNRQSGVGALGMGLLNMSDSDDDSDDEDSRKKQSTPASKNAALAAATGAVSPPPRTSSKEATQPEPQYTQPIIAAPRPGYAAPIAALNLARPETASTRAPPPQPIDVPSLENPFEPPMAQVYHPNGGPMVTSPSPSIPPSSPHPLQPPITPITPVFARPAKPGGVTFSEPGPRTKPIMRGNNEETLLPRRGEKGDDFWRRFSMVAKIENTKPPGAKER